MKVYLILKTMMKSNCMGNFHEMRMNSRQMNSENEAMNSCFSMMKQMCMPESNESKSCCDQVEHIPENLSALFNEWYKSLEEEVIKYTNKNKKIDVDDIAKEFKLNRESVLMLLNSIEQKAKQSTES